MKAVLAVEYSAFDALPFYHPGKNPFCCEQFFGTAAFDDSAVVEDDLFLIVSIMAISFLKENAKVRLIETAGVLLLTRRSLETTPSERATTIVGAKFFLPFYDFAVFFRNCQYYFLKYVDYALYNSKKIYTKLKLQTNQ
ncbi:MAG: hypothetical protein LBQ01_05320 [Prevotellaceae bacterium]|jgi:hypothetical protein|nr:hypothetical protein [Prevotellaceae bacterium]